jgi:aspartate-semialdehyde dehydrogenase
MTPTEARYNVAIVGASSLLGREVRAVIRERHFPFSHLIELEATASMEADPELPVLDIEKDEAAEFLAAQEASAGIDVAFVAAPADPAQVFLASGLPSLVIDLDGGLAEPDLTPEIAFLDRAVAPQDSVPRVRMVASAHPATMVLGALLLRLQSRAEITTAAAQVFSPASHLGPRGIEELQKQTVNLLSFQRIPRAIFGSQLAFNMLSRLAGSGSGPLESLENRVRGELGRFLGGRAPLPAIRLVQAPVFYSMAVSLYVETADILTPAKAAQALAGEPVRVTRASEKAPSQVDVTGTADILVDSIIADAGRPSGLWIWAAADNLRLAAANAVEIAENVLRTGHPGRAARGQVH